MNTLELCILFLSAVSLIGCAHSSKHFAPEPSGSKNHRVEPEILYVGDSWSSHPFDGRAIERMLVNEGYELELVRGIECAGIVGQETIIRRNSYAAHWTSEDYQQRIRLAMEAYLSIRVISVSLGGNELIDLWNAGMSEQEQAELIRRICGDVDTVLQKLTERYPSKRIVLNSYDFPNFHRSLWLGPIRKLWRNAGKPSPEQINRMLAAFTREQQAVAARHPNVVYINHLGSGQRILYGATDIKKPTPARLLKVDGFHPNLAYLRGWATRCLAVYGDTLTIPGLETQ